MALYRDCDQIHICCKRGLQITLNHLNVVVLLTVTAIVCVSASTTIIIPVSALNVFIRSKNIKAWVLIRY